MIEEGINEKTFQTRKERYLASSEDLLEKSLIEEVKREDLLEVRELLQPLVKMLYAASSAASDNPSLTLVSDVPQYHLFYDLPISQTDQDNIYQLIKKMADYGYWDLLKKKKDMEKLGDKVYHVHPLCFIGYIYSHPNLKKRMPKILDDVLGRKKNGFLNGHGSKEGFSQRMTKEMNSNNLMQYLPGFAQSLGISEGEIAHFFHHRDWEGLLRHLIHRC